MDIQFSAQAAQKACLELEEQSQNIEKNKSNLSQINSNMKGDWTGDLANAMIGRLNGCVESLEQVKAFTDTLNAHIDTCRQNYQLTETTNSIIMQSIASLFH